jgi:hypothetical protein
MKRLKMKKKPIKTVGDIKKKLEKTDDNKPVLIWDLGAPALIRAHKNRRLRGILDLKDGVIIEIEDERVVDD